jgi:two-component system, sensor histidine kinase and response regulator
VLFLKDIASKNLDYHLPVLAFLAALRGKIEGLKIFGSSADKRIKEQEPVEELTRQIAIMNRLLSIIAHDIRSPLTSLKSILPFLVNRNLRPDDLQRTITSIDHQVDQLTHFLDNVLRWAKNNTEEIRPRFERIMLHTLVDEVIELHQLQAKKKHVQVYTNIPKTITVMADKEMLRVVLRNLVSNALKFSNPVDSVHVRAEAHEGLVNISVQDTGAGISPEAILNLFTFSHLSTKGTRNEIGTGLGLTLCKEFVEKMGGKISVESAKGRGSCFEFTIHSPTSTSPEFQKFMEKQG